MAAVAPSGLPCHAVAEESRANGRFERALVVGAHPDDPEFGFGGTVAKLTAEGTEVIYVVCTDGCQGGEDPAVPDAELSAVRYAEQRAAAEVLGVREVVFLGFRDGSLAPTLELRRAITREIRRWRPDLVLTHAPLRSLDGAIGAFHPDHLAAGEATLSAVYPDARNPRAFRELLAEGLQPHRVREVWMPGFDHADHVVELSPELVERKIEAIRCHRSQFDKPEMEPGAPAVWVRERMRKAGEKAGVEYAEAFKRIETA